MSSSESRLFCKPLRTMDLFALQVSVCAESPQWLGSRVRTYLRKNAFKLVAVLPPSIPVTVSAERNLLIEFRLQKCPKTESVRVTGHLRTRREFQATTHSFTTGCHKDSQGRFLRAPSPSFSNSRLRSLHKPHCHHLLATANIVQRFSAGAVHALRSTEGLVA